MATRWKTDTFVNTLNNGYEYEVGDQPSIETFNVPYENTLYLYNVISNMGISSIDYRSEFSESEGEIVGYFVQGEERTPVVVPYQDNADNITKGTLLESVLPNSGVVKGSYGMSSNTTGTDGTKIYIPYITVDEKGRVKSIYNRTFTAKDTHPTSGSQFYRHYTRFYLSGSNSGFYMYVMSTNSGYYSGAAAMASDVSKGDCFLTDTSAITYNGTTYSKANLYVSGGNLYLVLMQASNMVNVQITSVSDNSVIVL